MVIIHSLIQTDIQLSGVTVSSAAWGDFDNDGDLDILLAGFDNDMKDITKLYQNNGDNSFSELGSGLTVLVTVQLHGEIMIMMAIWISLWLVMMGPLNYPKYIKIIY